MTGLLGVDIGGTHTDVVHLANGRLAVTKLPTTAQAADGLLSGAQTLGVALEGLELIIHGTTVATNAVIQRRGARCGLITTAGFRDVLELRRRDRPHTYGLDADFQPLIERRDRCEVGERVTAEGEILTPVDGDQVAGVAAALRDDGCEVLVICFLHSYANPENERRARQAAAAVWPNEFIVTSSEVLPALREFERSSTATIGGYVQPLVVGYLEALKGQLSERGFTNELLVVQSNGGVMAAGVAGRFAANTILSGPAAGVTAATAIAAEMGIDNAVSCDMGGTSLDICVIQDGRPATTAQKALDFGLPLALPMLDVDAVGAGGGSLAWIDGSGVLQIGPQSAGAEPGPAALGIGSEPTVTDANLVLGRLDPELAIGHDQGQRLDPEAAGRAIMNSIGEPLELGPDAAAEAIVAVAGHKMAGQIRRQLLGRGLDPRQFTLIAFGGAGPLHAADMVREAGLAAAVVPPYPGLTSALGCLLGELRHDFVRTVNRPLGDLSQADLENIYAEQRHEGLAVLAREGIDEDVAKITLAADMSYRGQLYTIAVTLSVLAPEGVRSDFETAYRTHFTRLLEGAEIMLVNARTTVGGGGSTMADFDLSALAKLPDVSAAPEPCQIYCAGAWQPAERYRRFDLAAGTQVTGPALLTQDDSTVFVAPGFKASVQASGNLLLEAQT
ncbi:MAG: hydantoinase/oxoprolinase family protein [Alphaproteobacteria bacterium]|jgi:N-methylhydantoinase A|nr:hydantoinase/oxoprolinase family protein [Alphaproteobacteria bacterium]HJP20462.1 hydantoinase/oxoprolinase family protein [Alphaproteobacteria bacterium]